MYEGNQHPREPGLDSDIQDLDNISLSCGG